ncbi:MAG: extracellular solute-binding protein [Nostoc sp. DedQUE08]|uniref:extracellular solute-binding protein n=1 Tax=unclassified Nostoc TaxID=2593658 RepID=UPI002AD3CC70|nr:MULTISPECIES: extracellular solute-binding protein [unclassified Nostoc]MDZ8033879.1 extracellular solute-binding protein [Nostoc sp. DedSLP04]MDZ8065795.1 extracellular solute-binding protein [Nostoc sp. DedQUE08]MDZ8092156.1 extracellular solute-binding protein [Nostoc sp. DedQUE05]
MDRRSFLLGTSTLALSQLLFGCGGNKQTQLKVQLLKGSIPGQVVNRFHKGLQQQVQLKFAPVEHIQDLFHQLQNWQQKPKTSDEQGWRRFIPFRQGQKAADADLVTLGDYWLQAAIEQKLIQPLQEMQGNQLKQWSTLNERWKQLVTRNDQGILDTQGKVWGAPYRWGSTVIVYNRDKLQKLGWTPKDWSDLWRDGMQQRISLLNQPREVIGLVLKKLGKSYNTDNLDQVPDLEKELQILNQQVKFYSSNNYLEPLIMEDTWLAVGWSSDVLPILGRYPQLAAVIPQSGTAIWADLWVRPAGITKDSLSDQWIDFCWQPSTAKQISVLTKTNSPISTNIAASDIQEPLWSLLESDRKVFDKSEFLLPLPPSAIKQYESLFAKMKV